jgi:hypothetical protein
VLTEKKVCFLPLEKLSIKRLEHWQAKPHSLRLWLVAQKPAL